MTRKDLTTVPSCRTLKEEYSNENSYRCKCENQKHTKKYPKRNRRILCKFVAQDETQGINILTECKIVRTTDEAFYEYMQFQRFMREEVWPLVRKDHYNSYTCKLFAYWVKR